MTKRLISWAVLATCLLAGAAKAETPTGSFKGFVKVRADRELYVDFVKPQGNRPTVVLLNGLTYSTRQYDAFVRPLLARGLGVVRFDFDGMGMSLLKYVPWSKPYAWEQQVRDTRALLMAIGLRPPYNFVGLSYGGGIEAGYAMLFPKEVKNLIMIAPYTQPLDGQDNWIKNQIWITRKTFPNNPATDDELYDFFLHQIVYATYPAAEPVVLENPYKLEAVYNLVRGIRKFRPVDVANTLPPGTVHLMVAVADQYIPAGILENFWKKVPAAAKMSRIRVFQTEHKMPEAIPDFTAGWVWQVLKGNPLLTGGRDFEGYPSSMTAKSGNQVIKVSE